METSSAIIKILEDLLVLTCIQIALKWNWYIFSESLILLLS